MLKENADRMKSQIAQITFLAILASIALINSQQDSCVANVQDMADTFILNDGFRVPRIGFGTAGLGRNAEESIKNALLEGFRHIDSAQANEWYDEVAVGRAIHQVFEESNLTRSDIFITSKLHPRDFGNAYVQFYKSLADLKTDYVDLFLLHYYECWSGLKCQGSTGTWKDAWRALSQLKLEGKIKSIGVSNFSIHQLEELIDFANEFGFPMPAVLQSWSDPFSQNRPVQKLCAQHNIIFFSYSTLGTQHTYRHQHQIENPVLFSPVLSTVGAKYGVSVVRVVLSWAIQRGMGVLPRTSNLNHLQENATFLKPGTNTIEVFLSEEDLILIDQMDNSSTIL